MDTRKRKLRGIFVLSVLIILCLSVASVISYFIPNKSADAISDLSTATNIGELLLDNYATRADKMVFNSDKLSTLYKQLTGTATYDKVEELSEKTLNGNNFRTNNNGKDIMVTINGLLWNATFLSRNIDGDPIVTLWLANSNQLPTAYRTAQWNSYGENENGIYPTNMYGTSKIRAVTLNNGGKYATSLTTMSADEVEQDSNSPFAIYTMDGIEGSLTSFIDSPSNVKWQETQKNTDYHSAIWNYTMNNDRYSMVSPGNLYDADIDYVVPPNGVTLEERTQAYTAWKEDKIWLPSMTEVGWQDAGARGMWNTRVSLRADTNNSEVWLRSADSSNVHDVYTLLPNATANHFQLANETGSVRPAFHLNLRKAEEASNAIAVPPTTGESIYNAEAVDLTSEAWYTDNIKNYVDVSYEYFKVGQDPATETGTTVTEIKNAGVYKVKFSIKDPTLHLWKGGGGAKTLTYTVKQKTLGVNFNADTTPPTAIPTGLCSSESNNLQDTILRIKIGRAHV